MGHWGVGNVIHMNTEVAIDSTLFSDGILKVLNHYLLMTVELVIISGLTYNHL